MSTPTVDQPSVSCSLLIALAVVAVAAVAFVAVVMLGSSADDAELAAGPTESVSGPSEAGSEVADPDETVGERAETPDEIAGVEPRFDVFDARNPFDQLVSDDTGDGGDTVGTTQPASDTTAPEGTQPVDG